MLVAQSIATLRHFTHGLEVNFESVEGFARTDRETREVMSNANGQCLYLTKEAAEQRSSLDRVAVRPFRMTAAGKLVILGE